MKGRSRNKRLGTMLFFIPIVLVLALVGYAIIDTTTFRDGTLIVRAQTSNRYYPVEYLNVSVSVSGKSGITPFHISLSPGTYTVRFPSQQWFTSPSSRTVNVTAGGTSFVVGVYNPIPVSVSLDQGKFNTSAVSVLHRVTPLIWINLSSDYEVITSDLTGRIIIAPMQNYTYVFQSQGTFAFSFVGISSPDLTVSAI
jgi:hypothetical protein